MHGYQHDHDSLRDRISHEFSNRFFPRTELLRFAGWSASRTMHNSGSSVTKGSKPLTTMEVSSRSKVACIIPRWTEHTTERFPLATSAYGQRWSCMQSGLASGLRSGSKPKSSRIAVTVSMASRGVSARRGSDFISRAPAQRRPAARALSFAPASSANWSTSRRARSR
jgi:hypothetical protein